jgi:hypothetical protein
MAEEHEAQQPYKCAVCGEKFDSQEQAPRTFEKMHGKESLNKAEAVCIFGHWAIPRDRSSRNHLRGVNVSVIAHPPRLIDESGPRHRCSGRIG